MITFKRSIITGVVGAICALAAMPAGASASCVSDPTVPDCVNHAIDTAERAAAQVNSVYDREVQPRVDAAACLAVHVATGRDC